MATAPTEPGPVEGPREDEPAADETIGTGASAQEPAEGPDDAPAGGGGSAR